MTFTRPSDSKVLGSENAATVEDVNEACRLAKAAQKIWAKTSFATRKDILADLIDTILVNRQDLCEVSMSDTGKTSMSPFIRIVTHVKILKPWQVK